MIEYSTEHLSDIYSKGLSQSHDKGLRAVFEAGVAAGRPRHAVFAAEAEPTDDLPTDPDKTIDAVGAAPIAGSAPRGRRR